MNEDIKEIAPYLIPTQKLRRLSSKKQYELFSYFCHNQLPDEDARHVSDIATGVAMYEVPNNTLNMVDDKEGVKGISFTTDNFNQVTSYFMHKYGYVNGSVMTWIMLASAKAKGDMKKLKKELKVNAKQLLRTRVKDMRKQGQLITWLLEVL